VKTDRQGLPMTGTAEAVAYFDAAVDSLLHFRVDLLDAVHRAVIADPTQPMARVFSAYLRLLGTEPDGAVAGRREFSQWAASAAPSHWTDREHAHVAAVEDWLAGDMIGAGETLRQLTARHPRDVLALSVGHQIDFLTGDSALLCERVGRALPDWSPDDLHYSLLLGMHAFGLEESGEYEHSEQVGYQALALDPTDVWGIHAVVHTHEMRGRFGEGLSFLDERIDEFDQGNFFRVHNWWHYCLFSLEAGRPDLALAVFDGVLHPEGGEPVAMELLDATALLWRLYLEGDDQTERFASLADDWAPMMDVAQYAFNDMHAVMAYVGAGRLDEAETLIADREHYLEVAARLDSNVRFTREVGRPVCQAVLAFGRSDYEEVLRLLLPIRHRLHLFGGSHAQRDVVQRTLLVASMRAGSFNVAARLMSERLQGKAFSPYNWLKLAALEKYQGRGAESDVAAARARALIDAAEPSFAAVSTLVTP
jgi:hypothetical protein